MIPCNHSVFIFVPLHQQPCFVHIRKTHWSFKICQSLLLSPRMYSIDEHTTYVKIVYCVIPAKTHLSFGLLFNLNPVDQRSNTTNNLLSIFYDKKLGFSIFKHRIFRTIKDSFFFIGDGRHPLITTFVKFKGECKKSMVFVFCFYLM